jgi:nucleoside 2-deoxyribosyltransferase
MPHRKIIRCVLSGSFRRDRPSLLSIYDELITCGCQVLSPHRLDFNNEKQAFVRDRAEDGLSEAYIEEHHLVSIKQSDFLWVHAFEGYVGLSTALEIGYAIANKIPIFSSVYLSDPVFKPFIRVIPSVYKAIEYLRED